MLPAFGLEGISIWTEEIGASVHDVGYVEDYCAFGYEEWSVLGGAATEWEDCVSNDETGVRGDDRVEA